MIFVLGFFDKSGLQEEDMPRSGSRHPDKVVDSGDTAAQFEINSNMETEESGALQMMKLMWRELRTQ